MLHNKLLATIAIDVTITKTSNVSFVIGMHLFRRAF